MSGFHVIDIVFGVLIILLALRGWLQGFVREFCSWASVLLGLAAALCFYKKGAEFLREKFLGELAVVPEFLSFVIIGLVVFFVIKVVEKILADVIEGVRLGGVNKALGLLFGVAEGLVVTALLLFLAQVQPLFDAGPVLEASFFARMLLPLIARLPALPVTPAWPPLPEILPEVISGQESPVTALPGAARGQWRV